jgi:hypothetical protein
MHGTRRVLPSHGNLYFTGFFRVPTIVAPGSRGGRFRALTLCPLRSCPAEVFEFLAAHGHSSWRPTFGSSRCIGFTSKGPWDPEGLAYYPPLLP